MELQEFGLVSLARKMQVRGRRLSVFWPRSLEKYPLRHPPAKSLTLFSRLPIPHGHNSTDLNYRIDFQRVPESARSGAHIGAKVGRLQPPCAASASTRFATPASPRCKALFEKSIHLAFRFGDPGFPPHACFLNLEGRVRRGSCNSWPQRRRSLGFTPRREPPRPCSVDGRIGQNYV